MVSTKVTSPGVACPLDHSSSAKPMTAARSTSSVDALRGAVDRAAHPGAPRAAAPFGDARWRSRASSRASAPKALTTALQLTASASAPPSCVSQALASRAAGAT